MKFKVGEIEYKLSFSYTTTVKTETNLTTGKEVTVFYSNCIASVQYYDTSKKKWRSLSPGCTVPGPIVSGVASSEMKLSSKVNQRQLALINLTKNNKTFFTRGVRLAIWDSYYTEVDKGKEVSLRVCQSDNVSQCTANRANKALSQYSQKKMERPKGFPSKSRQDFSLNEDLKDLANKKSENNIVFS